MHKVILINIYKKVKDSLNTRKDILSITENILENNLDHVDFEQESEQELPNHSNIRGKQYYN